MRKRLALLLLLLTTPIFANAADKVNPADYTVVIHVVFSRVTHLNIGTSFSAEQQLKCLIDGRKVELRAERGELLAPGDYKGRLIPHFRAPKNPNTYEVFEAYDFLFPNGETRIYTVVGLGPAVDSSAPSSPPAPTHP